MASSHPADLSMVGNYSRKVDFGMFHGEIDDRNPSSSHGAHVFDYIHVFAESNKYAVVGSGRLSTEQAIMYRERPAVRVGKPRYAADTWIADRRYK